MSGSADAVRAMQAVVTSRHTDVRQAAVTYGTSIGGIQGAASDVTAVMQAMVPAIIAAEALESAAGEAVRAFRAVLAEQMTETGCTTLRTAAHVVSSVTPARRTFVADRTLVPERFMRPRPPEPDMDAIKREMAAGNAVPGIGQTNGGPNGLRIATRKDAA